jgi:hypothetical protein
MMLKIKKVFLLSLCIFMAAGIFTEAHADGIFFLSERTPDGSAVTALNPQSFPDTIEEYTDQYYKHCLADTTSMAQGDTLEYLCACTASQLPAQATIKMLHFLETSTTSQTKITREQMNAAVFAPCMPAVVEDITYASCLNSKDFSDELKYPETTCRCFSDYMVGFWEEKGYQLLARPVRAPETVYDPLRKFFETPIYRSKLSEFTLNCIRGVERGL